jgi:hypothetical protein
MEFRYLLNALSRTKFPQRGVEHAPEYSTEGPTRHTALDYRTVPKTGLIDTVGGQIRRYTRIGAVYAR